MDAFFIEDDDFLKVSADIKKEFDNKSVYKKELLKTKIKIQSDEVIDFYDKKNF